MVPNIRPGTAISHMPAATRPSRSAASSSRGDDVPSGCAGGVRSAQSASSDADDGDAAERRRDPDGVGERADRRADERAGDRGAHRGADHLAAPLARRGARRPTPSRPPTTRRRRCPGRSARASSTTIESANANARLDDDHQPEAEQHRGAHAGLRREVAARERADERAGRVGGGEHARGRLRQPELVLEVRAAAA